MNGDGRHREEDDRLPGEPDRDAHPGADDGFPEEAWEGAGRPIFLHPPWTVGVVLVFAVVALLLGLGGNPIWLLIGSPFILVLVLWLWVRIAALMRPGRDDTDNRS